MDSPPRETQKPYAGLHPEDVKAAIRKKFGTIAKFHEAHNLPPRGVQDVLRGRASRRVQDAMDQVLSDACGRSTEVDNSSAAA